MKQNQRIIIPLAYTFIGLFYFFQPFLAAWFQIVNPFIAKNFFLLFDWTIFGFGFSLRGVLGDYAKWFPDIVFVVISLFYLLFFFIKIIRSDWSNKLKRFAFLPLVIFPIIWVIMSPLGLSFWGEKRVNSYIIGGWSRVIMAGGAEVVRADGLELLNSPNENPTDDEVPSSIKRLGYWVMIEQDEKILLVGVGRMFNMADEFGFIIYDDSKPMPLPHYLEHSEYYRIWKLADGVYFFEQ